MGDGTELTVDIFGHQVCVNFELLVDVASGAFVGADVRANEDATAVTEALAAGIATPGAAPLSLLLDNKPSNHGSDVIEAVGEGPVLDQTFKRLALDDPQRHLRTSIASWPREAIVRGIAIFEGKRNAGTLPSGVDARYLRGIIKNVAELTEGQKIAEAMLRLRLQARDINLTSLQRSRESIQHDNLTIDKHLKLLINEVIDSDHSIDRTFWLLETAQLIRLQPDESRRALLQTAARRIFAHFKLPYRDRLNAVQQLFTNVIPLD